LKNNLKIKILDKDKLEVGKIYIMLLLEKYISEGEMKRSTPTVFNQINKKNISLLLLMARIQTELRRFEYEYGLDDYYG
jgi:hypothetical protein